jgi:Domain of unknown function (DUF5679)
MIIFCVKCKTSTNTIGVQDVTSKNGKCMLRGKCAVCGRIKTRFVKTSYGGSILNDTINNLPFELHPPGHNFTGPDTRLVKD